MTRDEIEAMPAGRELDRLVAEKVMGWSIYRYDKDIPENCYFMLVTEQYDPVTEDMGLRAGERKTEEEAWNDNYHFSTDISAAWEVVEKIGEKRFDVEIMRRTDGRYFATCIKVGNPLKDRLFEVHAEAGAAPLAICKAALLAMEASHETEA